VAQPSSAERVRASHCSNIQRSGLRLSQLLQTDDNLYALIFAKDSGSLNLSIGNSCESFSISPGVNKIKLPLDVGSPHAVLYDSAGNIVVDFAPSDFSYTGNSCSTYNFNYYTAMSP